jgi:hypothetical protein
MFNKLEIYNWIINEINNCAKGKDLLNVFKDK